MYYCLFNFDKLLQYCELGQLEEKWSITMLINNKTWQIIKIAKGNKNSKKTKQR